MSGAGRFWQLPGMPENGDPQRFDYPKVRMMDPADAAALTGYLPLSLFQKWAQ